jgi:GT2 family glycosyltransferase
MSPRVSVLILSRQRPERLGGCLASVRAQDFAEREIVVLTNGCAATADLVRREHPDVRLVELPENIGCAPGRNRLAELARGDFLLFLDDDGEIRDRTTLTRLVAAAEADQHVGVVGMGLLDAVSDEPTGWRLRTGRLPYPCYHASFAGGACLVRQEAWAQAGGYSESFRGFGEEFDLTVRLYAAGWAVLYYPVVVMHHHVAKDESAWWGEVSQGYRHLQYTIRRLYPSGWAGPAAWKALATQVWVTLRLNGGRGLLRDLVDARRWARLGRAHRRPVTRRALELLYFAKYRRVEDWETLQRAPRGLLRRVPWLRLRRKLADVPKLPLRERP